MRKRIAAIAVILVIALTAVLPVSAAANNEPETAPGNIFQQGVAGTTTPAGTTSPSGETTSTTKPTTKPTQPSAAPTTAPPTTTPTTEALADDDGKSLWDYLGDIGSGIADLLTFLLNPMSLLDTLLTSLASTIGEWALEIVGVVGEFDPGIALEHEWVSAVLDFFGWLAGILLAIGFVTNLLQHLEKMRHGDGDMSGFKDGLFGLLQGLGLILLARPVVILLSEYTMWIGAVLCNTDAVQGYTPDITLFSDIFEHIGQLFLGAAFAIVSLVMLWRLFKRMMTMFLQIILAYFYAYDLGKGDRVLGEWGREVVAGSVSFALQVVAYRMGVMFVYKGFTNNADLSSIISIADCAVGMMLLVGCGLIPHYLNRKWANTQGGGIGNLFGQAVNVGMTLLRKF